MPKLFSLTICVCLTNYVKLLSFPLIHFLHHCCHTWPSTMLLKMTNANCIFASLVSVRSQYDEQDFLQEWLDFTQIYGILKDVCMWQRNCVMSLHAFSWSAHDPVILQGCSGSHCMTSHRWKLQLMVPSYMKLSAIIQINAILILKFRLNLPQQQI